MKFHALSLGVAFNAAVSSALRIPFQQARSSILERRNGGASVSVFRPSATLAKNNILAAASGGAINANGFDMKCIQLLYRTRQLVC